MIGKVGKGNRVGGLLHYLFGPGRANEHTDPHLIASWDASPAALEPATDADGQHEVGPLAQLLEQPLKLLRRKPKTTVWHCSVRAAPGDRELTDAEWAQVAEKVVHTVGFAEEPNDDGCRWVAVRHATDHIHVVVTLARQDGRRPSTSHDFQKVGRACRWAEDHFNLTATAPRDRTAAPRPTRAEREKSTRTRREPSRPRLRREVTAAAIASADPNDFLTRLRDAGVLVRVRYSERNPGQITGYAVALPGDRTRDGEPVWFGGGRLAPDLTWPKLQRRWRPNKETTAASTRTRIIGPARHQAWDDATAQARAAAEIVRRHATNDPAAAADAAHATAGMLRATAVLVEGQRGGPLTDAADTFERASRLPYGRMPNRSTSGDSLRVAARILAALGRTSGNEVGQVIALVFALASLADAVGRLRAAQDRLAQARAAAAAATQLRAAINDLPSTQLSQADALNARAIANPNPQPHQFPRRNLR